MIALEKHQDVQLGDRIPASVIVEARGLLKVRPVQLRRQLPEKLRACHAFGSQRMRLAPQE